MEKKIIAIALVLVLMVTAFVGCGQKYKTTKVGGNEYLLETDAEGNTLVEGNQLVAVVTDSDGEIITYENGENQTYYVPIPGSLVIDGIVRGENFTLNILDGWTSTDYDRINKDGTDNKCFIQFSKTSELENKEKFEEAFAKTDKANEDMEKAINDAEKMKELIKTNPELAKYENCKCTVDISTTTFTSDAYPCRVYVSKIVNADGNVVHYSENYYFLVEKTIYCVAYTCVDGEGYDESFNFRNYINENFTFIEEKKK